MANDVITKPGTERVATPDMLNAIRAEASQAFQDAVPLATASNLQEVGNPIVNYEPVANEFVAALLNKIVMTLVDRAMWSNPLAILRQEDMPLGMDIEEVQTNPAEANRYDGTENGMADILKMHKPDTVSEYHRLNRQDKYVVTINNQQLRHAFTGWANMENFIASLVDTLYNGNSIDEFEYTKQLVSDAYTNGKITTDTIPMPIDRQSSEVFMEKLRTLSTMFTFPSNNFNKYTAFNNTAKPRKLWTPIENQIIIVRADVATKVGVSLMASLFNVEYANYLARQIIVDSLDPDDKVLAVLADRKAFMIMSQLRQFASFYNPSSLGWQYYYHAWDLFSFSMLKNSVAIVTP